MNTDSSQGRLALGLAALVVALGAMMAFIVYTENGGRFTTQPASTTNASAGDWSPTADDDITRGYLPGHTHIEQDASACHVAITTDPGAALWLNPCGAAAPTPTPAPTATPQPTPTLVPTATPEPRAFSMGIPSPDDAIDHAVWRTAAAFTITRESCVLVGSSVPSLTVTLRHSTDRSAAGNELTTGGTVVTSTTTGDEDTGPFDDDTVPANAWVWLETTAQSGTIDEATCTYDFDYD